MEVTKSSDRSLEGLVKTRDHIGARRRQDPESGQAVVEFALILFPLLILVAGIIQFGIGLNYWLDMNRIANTGARFAVVNAWPGCDRLAAAGSCSATPACTASPPTNTTLENYMKCQTISQGLRGTVAVSVCYPNDGDPANDGKVGSPVRVNLDAPFRFVPILGLGTLNLRGRATMRLEQETVPTGASGNLGHLSGVSACPP
jgi:Flp pilus assembly protein TadG